MSWNSKMLYMVRFAAVMSAAALLAAGAAEPGASAGNGMITPACTPGSATSGMPFCDAGLPRDARAWDLIQRLNLTEKVRLLSAQRAWVERLGVHGIEGNECLHGLFNRGSNVEINGTVVQYPIDGAATAFPQSIGMAATWNRTLLNAMGDVISTEAVAKRNGHRLGNGQAWPQYLTCWAPVRQLRRRFGPALTHFSPTHHPARAVCHAPLSDHACETLIGACNL